MSLSILSILPDEILFLLISEWIESYIDLSALDIAFASRKLREKYFHTLQIYKCTCHNVLFEMTSSSETGQFNQRLKLFIDWIQSRNISLSKFGLHRINSVHCFPWRVLHRIEELTIHFEISFSRKIVQSINFSELFSEMHCLHTLKFLTDEPSPELLVFSNCPAFQCKALRRLEIQYFSLPPFPALKDSFDALAAQCPNLEVLRLLSVRNVDCDSLWYLAKQLKTLHTVVYENIKYGNGYGQLRNEQEENLQGESGVGSIEESQQKMTSDDWHCCNNLRDLDLSGTVESSRKSCDGLFHMLSGSCCVSKNGLENLTLRDFLFTDRDTDSLQRVSASWFRLKSLSLLSVRWATFDLFSLIIRSCTRLKMLKLVDISGLQDSHCHTIAQNLSLLESLQLGYLDNLSDEGVRSLCNGKLKKLNEIVVHQCVELTILSYKQLLETFCLQKINFFVEVKHFTLQGDILELGRLIANYEKREELVECQFLLNRYVKHDDSDLIDWSFDYPRLQLLRFYHVPNNHELLQRLLRNCPNLKVLKLTCSSLQCLEKVDFHHSHLKELDLFLINVNLYEELLHSMIVKCPALQLLTIYQTGCQITREVFQNITRKFFYRLKLIEHKY